MTRVPRWCRMDPLSAVPANRARRDWPESARLLSTRAMHRELGQMALPGVALPFHLRGFGGEVAVYSSENRDPARWGFDILGTVTTKQPGGGHSGLTEKRQGCCRGGDLPKREEAGQNRDRCEDASHADPGEEHPHLAQDGGQDRTGDSGLLRRGAAGGFANRDGLQTPAPSPAPAAQRPSELLPSGADSTVLDSDLDDSLALSPDFAR